METNGENVSYRKDENSLAEPMDQNGSSEDIQATVGETKAKLCAMCGAQSKYCCPACSLRTCSLKCVSAHKLEKQCNGVRDKTAFVDVNQFSNMNLLSDYRFLEEVARTVDNAERARRKQGFFQPKRLPINLAKLKKAAEHRKTLLHIMPKVFSRRKVNTTYLRYSDNVIFWKIEWSFPQIGESFCDDKVDEKTSINNCLDKYLSPDNSSLEIQEKLSYFQALGHKGVCVLLKKEKGPANDTRFFELNKNKSLKENFANKEITEYPTLFVIGKEHRHVFNLVEDGR